MKFQTIRAHFKTDAHFAAALLDQFDRQTIIPERFRHFAIVKFGIIFCIAAWSGQRPSLPFTRMIPSFSLVKVALIFCAAVRSSAIWRWLWEFTASNWSFAFRDSSSRFHKFSRYIASIETTAISAIARTTALLGSFLAPETGRPWS